MSGILFLAHRLPYPADRGDKIRSHHILRALAKLAPVHVGCFAESAADRAHQSRLSEIAASHCMPLRAKPLALAGVEALVRRQPVSLAAFRDDQLLRWVRATLAREDIDTIYVFSGQMGQYVPAGWTGQVIVDLVDVDSAKFEAYAEQSTGLKRFVHAREARLLAAEEARLVARADTTLLVSEAEAALLRSRLPATNQIVALGNGVDAANFDPHNTTPHPALAASGPNIVFTGQMDYPANVQAALRTVERLLPSIRAAHPDATFHIVGRAPTADLRSHDGHAGVRVWGGVPDVRPFLVGADLVLAPLEIARGVQNKVLEAMAMARPVLLSPGAATGMDARDGEHFVVAVSDAQLIERALRLLAAPDVAHALGVAARRFVIDEMSWAARLAPLPRLVGREFAEQRDAA